MREKKSCMINFLDCQNGCKQGAYFHRYQARWRSARSYRQNCPALRRAWLQGKESIFLTELVLACRFENVRSRPCSYGEALRRLEEKALLQGLGRLHDLWPSCLHGLGRPWRCQVRPHDARRDQPPGFVARLHPRRHVHSGS